LLCPQKYSGVLIHTWLQPGDKIERNDWKPF